MADTGTPRLPDPNEISFREGLVIVAAVTCLMVGLVILRFACIIAIDICILGDTASARHRLRQCRNWFCCCKRRIRDEEELVPQEHHYDLELVDLEALLSTLSTHERNLLIDSILTGKVVTSEDLSSVDKLKGCDPEAIHDDNGSCSEPALCSICLHEFECGQETAKAKACHHIFHHDCLRQWLTSSNNNTACPYCRAAIITAADVKRTLHVPIDSS